MRNATVFGIRPRGECRSRHPRNRAERLGVCAKSSNQRVHRRFARLAPGRERRNERGDERSSHVRELNLARAQIRSATDVVQESEHFQQSLDLFVPSGYDTAASTVGGASSVSYTHLTLQTSDLE